MSVEKVGFLWHCNWYIRSPERNPKSAHKLMCLQYHKNPTFSMLMSVTPAMLPTLRIEPPVPAASATSCHSLSSVGTSLNISMDASTKGTLSTTAEEIPSIVHSAMGL